MRGEILDGQKWITLYGQSAKKGAARFITFNGAIKFAIIHWKRSIRGMIFDNNGMPVWLRTRIPMPFLFSTNVTLVFTFKILRFGGFQICWAGMGESVLTEDDSWWWRALYSSTRYKAYHDSHWNKYNCGEAYFRYTKLAKSSSKSSNILLSELCRDLIEYTWSWELKSSSICRYRVKGPKLSIRKHSQIKYAYLFWSGNHNKHK